MYNSKRKKIIGLLLVLMLSILSISTPFQQFASFPYELRLFSGQGKQLHLHIPVYAKVNVNRPDIIQVNGSSQTFSDINLNEPIHLQSGAVGKTEMRLSLFGKIPFKKLTVNVIPDLKVIPGGQTIGVKLKSKGILVVGHHLVTDQEGNKVSPGEDAQIRRGDIITHMNGIELKDMKQVSEIVEKAGKKNETIEIEIVRNHKTSTVQLTPVLDQNDKVYRLGLYIRDSAAGVGTLTYYAPDQGLYGALGHMITDMDTQTAIPVGEGKILHSNVTSISKSRNGIPGEKRAQFYNSSKVLGNIERNTQLGIFGKMNELPEHGYTNEPLPVAFAEEVKEGPAYILTVVEGQKVEKFDIEIVHAAHQDGPATKGMVIKITDPRLLDKTGGIVQGMSGSPIIQNDKIIGAVTHVFVNDPSSGYGCFIEWMLQDGGIMLQAEDTAA